MSKQNINATLELIALIAGTWMVVSHFGTGGWGMVLLAFYAKSATIDSK